MKTMQKTMHLMNSGNIKSGRPVVTWCEQVIVPGPKGLVTGQIEDVTCAACLRAFDKMLGVAGA